MFPLSCNVLLKSADRQSTDRQQKVMQNDKETDRQNNGLEDRLIDRKAYRPKDEVNSSRFLGPFHQNTL